MFFQAVILVGISTWIVAQVCEEVNRVPYGRELISLTSPNDEDCCELCGALEECSGYGFNSLVNLCTFYEVEFWTKNATDNDDYLFFGIVHRLECLVYNGNSPHPRECAKWMECEEGEVVAEGQCGKGYLFDYEALKCVVKRKAKCWNSVLHEIGDEWVSIEDLESEDTQSITDTNGFEPVLA